MNIGFILGEVVRHVTGKNVGQFIRDEISLPLNAEYQIGLKDGEAERLSDMHLNTENAFWAMGADPNSNLHRAWSGKPASGDFLNSEHIRKGIFPAFGGHGNARGVATIYAALAGNGQLNGVRILSENAVKRAAQLVWERKCYMTGWDLRMGLGFEQNSTPRFFNESFNSLITLLISCRGVWNKVALAKIPSYSNCGKSRLMKSI